MKKVLLTILVATSFSAVAGNCTYPDDIAADGSVCGARAASVRAGGEVPAPEYSAPVAVNTYVNKADCTNGYSVIETTVMNANEFTTVVFMKDGKTVASKSGNNSDIETTAVTLNAGVNITNVVATSGSLQTGNLKPYTLAYEWNSKHFNSKAVDNGVIAIGYNVVAQCKETMIGG